MAGGDDISFLLDLDSEEFASKITDAVGKVKNLQEELAKVASVAGVVGAAYLALKTSLELAFESEQLRSLEVQFQSLAAQAGIAGDKILEGMAKASDGLLDTSDSLELANKAIVQLGASANRIPELMEIARKASIVFGGSIQDAFERITQAVATGQTRQLKQLGVIVDSDKAYRAYAASIGVATNSLSEQGKIQAIANAVIPQLQDKLKGVDTTVKGTTDSWTKLKNSINDMREALAKAIGPSVAPAWTSALNSISDAAKGLADRFTMVFGKSEAEQESATISLYESRLEGLKTKLQAAKNAGTDVTVWNYLFGTKSASEQISDLEQQILTVEGVLQAQREKLQATKATEGGTGVGPAPEIGSGGPSVDSEKQKQAQIQFYQEMNQLRQADLAARIKSESDVAQVDSNFLQQKVLLAQQTQQQIIAIEASESFDRAQKDQLRLQAEQSLREQLLSIDADYQNRMQAALNNSANNTKSVFERMAADVSASTKRGADGTVNAYGGMKVATASLGKSFEGTFIAMGQGAKIGTDMIAKAFFGMIGDVAIHYGELALATSIWPPNPVGLAAAAGLFILGGTMKALAGDGGGASTAGAGASTASSISSASTTDSFVSPTPTEEQQKTKAIHIEVHGHIFDTPQTGQRIAEMLRDAQDATDVRIT